MPSKYERKGERIWETLRRLQRRGAKAHLVKLLGKLHPGDVAVAMTGMTPTERYGLFQTLASHFPDAVGSVLLELEPPQRVGLLARLSPEEIGDILQRVEVDDAVSLVESLPDDLKRPVLEIVDLQRELDTVQSHLETYAEDSAGRIMSTSFFAVPESMTVSQAIGAIQTQGDVDLIFYLYIVDEEGTLAGVTSLRQLLLARPDQTLAEIMAREVIHVDTVTDQEEVAELAARYDLLAIPVCEAGHLVGVVTVDDIVDVVEEEATEDFFKMAGTSGDELLYQGRSLRVAGIRLPWLMFNLFALMATGVLLEHFQSGFKEALFLLVFAPVVMGMGGNTGSQTSTITVRGLATGRVVSGKGRVASFVWQQVRVGAFLGLATGLVAGAVAQLLEKNLWYAAVVAVSLFVALCFASFTGALIPVLFERVGIDPAIASAPLVTTSNDVTGIVIYFGLATLLIERLIT